MKIVSPRRQLYVVVWNVGGSAARPSASSSRYLIAALIGPSSVVPGDRTAASSLPQQREPLLAGDPVHESHHRAAHSGHSVDHGEQQRGGDSGQDSSEEAEEEATGEADRQADAERYPQDHREAGHPRGVHG